MTEDTIFWSDCAFSTVIQAVAIVDTLDCLLHSDCQRKTSFEGVDDRVRTLIAGTKNRI